jgi:hypothetical protein
MAAKLIQELTTRLKEPEDVTYEGRGVEARTVRVVGNRLKCAGWNVDFMSHVVLRIRHPETV